MTHLAALDLISLETFHYGLVVLREGALPDRHLLNAGFLADIQRVWEASLTRLEAGGSVVPANYENLVITGDADYSFWYGDPSDISTNLVVFETKRKGRAGGTTSVAGYMAIVHIMRRLTFIGGACQSTYGQVPIRVTWFEAFTGNDNGPEAVDPDIWKPEIFRDPKITFNGLLAEPRWPNGGPSIGATTAGCESCSASLVLAVVSVSGLLDLDGWLQIGSPAKSRGPSSFYAADQPAQTASFIPPGAQRDRKMNRLPLGTMSPRAASSPAAANSGPASPLGRWPPLGALPPLPVVPCQLCLKEARRDGKECVCVRDVSYRKCKRCQRIGKECEKVPLQLRRRCRSVYYEGLGRGELYLSHTLSSRDNSPVTWMIGRVSPASIPRMRDWRENAAKAAI
ncbi:hypothetical protein CNMCM5623_001023 [Aspergillus felis]|uniref:Uncharacterized protein n=1 Tax=Aspergillus felis TaxID=1287682 RepID=A0A8H6Q7H1_9EURO|nr:hypothetical protein CNMCM5623_001023 [Aspergillus felis]